MEDGWDICGPFEIYSPLTPPPLSPEVLRVIHEKAQRLRGTKVIIKPRRKESENAS